MKKRETKKKTKQQRKENKMNEILAATNTIKNTFRMKFHEWRLHVTMSGMS